jgi:hypothetical protein
MKLIPKVLNQQTLMSRQSAFSFRLLCRARNTGSKQTKRWILTVGPICRAVFGGFIYNKIYLPPFPEAVPANAEVKKEEREAVSV